MVDQDPVERDEAAVLEALDSDSPDRALGVIASGPALIICPGLGTGRIAVTRYHEARRVLRDPAFGCGEAVGDLLRSLPTDLRAALAPVASWLLYSNSPDHGRLRDVISGAFTSSRIDAVVRSTEARVDSLLDVVEDRGACDLVQEVSQPLPLHTMAALLRLPDEDCRQLGAWSDDLIRIIEPSADREDVERIAFGWERLWDYFSRVRERARQRHDDDLLSVLLTDRRLSESEAISNCIALLLGGHETTRNLLSAAALALACRPAVRVELIRDPGMVPRFVEEVVRFDGPAKMTGRSALLDTSLGGVPISCGQRLVVLMSAANRDPDVFSVPGEFMPWRPANPHLGFGFGAHTCIGAALARVEARVLVTRFVQRFRELDVARDGVQWTRSRVLRSIAALPVEVRAA